MRLILLISIFASVVLASNHTSDENNVLIEGCTCSSDVIYCRKYEHTYIPYKSEYGNARNISVHGSFGRMGIKTSGWYHIDGEKTWVEENENNWYQTIEVLDIQSRKLQQFPHPEITTDSPQCGLFKSLLNLTILRVEHSNLTSFDFRCLPRNLKKLSLTGNIISKLYYGEFLNNLTSLISVDLSHNRLKDVDFTKLPSSIKHLHLEGNEISNFNFSALSRFTSIEISIYGNPINCTCSVLFNYIRIYESDNVKMRCSEQNENYCLTCSEGSYLADYPWLYDIKHVMAYDHAEKECLNKRPNLIKGCEGSSDVIYCKNYQKTYIPYRSEYGNARNISVHGNFSNMDIKVSGWYYLNGRRLRAGDTTDEWYQNVEILDIQSKKLQQFPTPKTTINRFTYGSYYCGRLKSKQNLTILRVGNSNLTSFDFRCLPPNLEKLSLTRNIISKFDNVEEFSDLTSLISVDLSHNSLKDIDFNMLPSNIQHLHLDGNEINNFNFSALTRFPSIETSIYDNPVDCSCSVLIDYIRLLQSDNVNMICSEQSGNSCLTCSEESYLVDYPWSKNLTSLREHDDNAKQCLKNAMQCVMDGPMTSWERQLTCNDFQYSYLPYYDKYANVTSLVIKGKFSKLAISSKFEKIHTLVISSTNLQEFPLPSEDKVLRFNADQVSDTDRHSCQSLRKSSLTHLSLEKSDLKSFDFNCLPDTMLQLNLKHNKITKVNFADLERFPLMNVTMYNNPLDCTCADFVNLVRLEESGNANLQFPWSLTCSWQSELAYYGWDMSFAEIKEQDNNMNMCLISYYDEVARIKQSFYPHNGALWLEDAKCNFDLKDDLIFKLYCENIQETYLPSIPEWTYQSWYDRVNRYAPKISGGWMKVTVAGNFTKFALHSDWNFLKKIDIFSIELERFPFHDNLPGPQWEDCQALQSFEKLTELVVSNGKLAEFQFECLPPNIKKIDLSGNRISHISDNSCEAMKSLSKLSHIVLNDNNLQSFKTSCLPSSINFINLENNNITTVNLPGLSRFSHFFIKLHGNPIDCTCKLLVDYLLLNTEESTILFRSAESFKSNTDDEIPPITCAATSDLADYPWSTNMTTMYEHDSRHNRCLINHSQAVTKSYLSYQKNKKFLSTCVLERFGYNSVEGYAGYIDVFESRCIIEDQSQSFLPYMAFYDRSRSSGKCLRVKITVSGRFRQFGISSKYRCLKHLVIQSPYLEQFPFQDNSTSSRLEDCRRLKDATSLKQLNIERGKLKTFHFECLPRSLEELDLSDNNITHISSESCQGLKNLPSLYQLTIRRNRLQTAYFECLPPRIGVVDYDWNEISYISEESYRALKNLTLLTELMLRHTNLQTLNFEYLPDGIEYLRLMHTHLKVIDLSAFAKHPTSYSTTLHINCTCQTLLEYGRTLESPANRLRNHYIKCNEPSQFYSNNDEDVTRRNWRELYYRLRCHAQPSLDATVGGLVRAKCSIDQGTSLQCRKFPLTWLAYLEQFTNITRLDVRGKFKRLYVSHYEHLQELQIKSRKMKHFPDRNHCSGLNYLSSLRHLDLSGNNLQHFRFDCFPSSTTLVDLRNNNITYFNRKELSWYPNTTVLIAGNPLACNPTNQNKVSTTWLKKCSKKKTVVG